MEDYQIFIYAGCVTVALIGAWIKIERLIDSNHYLRMTIEDLNEDHNEISKENIQLRELLELQEKMFEDGI